MTLKENLVVCSANIITMNPQQPRAEALTVREGNVVVVGSWEDMEPYAEGVPVLDLAGKTVVPGMIDTHTHFLWTALSLAALDVSAADDHAALQRIIREALAGTPAGEPILGMGFTEYALDTSTFGPIIKALDVVAPDNPLLLMGVTGHTSAANTPGLELLDFPERTPGIMVGADGQPNGLLADKANNEAFGIFGERYGTDEKAAEMIARAVERAHSVGLTTVHALESGSTGDSEAAEDFLAAIPSLPLRFVFYYQILDVDKVLNLGLPRIGGCILLDGDVGPRTAALSEPYIDDPECYGTLYYAQEEIDGFVLAAHEAGLQVAMHAVGDAAVEQALDAYEAALNAYPRNDHRHRIEHCEVIREGQVERALRLGVALAIQPPFNHYWDHSEYYPSLGYERAWRADPVGSLMRPGLLIGGGSDSTVTPLGPLIGVHAAVNHSNPAERTSVYRALALYTINAARIAFQEHDQGSLEVGKLGDFVVLAEDPLEIDPRKIKDIPVEMTVIGGEIVYQATSSRQSSAGGRPMGRKVVIVKGSPRKSGNSAALAEQVAEGARAAGAQVESFYLHGMDIQPCDACDSCQGVEGLDCIIDDDMQALYPTLREADAIVYASPVYWFTVSAQLKLFMDRCYGMTSDIDVPGEHAFAGKRIGVVLAYGGDDPFDSGAINAIRTFQDVFNYIPAEIVGIVYGYGSEAGEIRENQDVMEEAYELGRRLGSGA